MSTFKVEQIEILALMRNTPFIALGAERVVLATANTQNEFVPFLYLVRLTAFGLIIAAVIDKNRVR